MGWKAILTVCCVFVGTFFAACQFANDERCPSGFFYVENLLSCCEVGNSIYHPITHKCHITTKNPSNCENQESVFLSVSFSNEQDETIVEEMCCPPDMTFYHEDECVDPVETEPSGDAGDGPPTGLGDLCDVGSTDCDDFEADYCLKHPLDPAKSYCVLLECQDTPECGDGFTCCDCMNQSTVEKQIACLKDADANLVKIFCDCDL